MSQRLRDTSYSASCWRNTVNKTLTWESTPSSAQHSARAERAYGARYVQDKIAMRRLQAHGLEPEGVPGGELLGELEAWRGEASCRDSGNIHC